MEEQFARTEQLIGTQALEKLKKSKVAIFGIGGVGSYTAEALTRAGIGHLVLIDKDCIELSNINRQIHATHHTVGKPKVEVMKQRLQEINPKIKVETHSICYLPQTQDKIINSSFDYVVDAVDMVTAKIEIIINAKKQGVPVISCMGTGNKLDPTKFQVTDITKTSVCPLAKVMRKELKKREISDVKVVFSTEEPIKNQAGQTPPASISFVPSVAGLIMAAEVIKDIIQ